MPLVTFQQDVFPYVRGDVVNLSSDEKKRVDEVVKGRKLDDAAYVRGDKRSDVVSEVGDARAADQHRAEAARDAALQNAVDQAAQLEAQRNAVGEPANVESLGVAPETPAQVVTGTEPVANVEVTNPQQATDTSDPQGAEVKSTKSKKQ